jgi:hypothetical protein
MLRRVVSIFVMLGYLAGQLAAVPHAHAGDGDHDHDAREPHFHLAWFGEYRHARYLQHEYQDHDSDVMVVDSDNCAIRVFQSAANDHDGDAVFVPSVLTAGTTLNGSIIGVLSWQGPSNWHCSVTLIDASAEPTSPETLLRPPNSPGQCCALFLKLQSLRI